MLARQLSGLSKALLSRGPVVRGSAAPLSSRPLLSGTEVESMTEKLKAVIGADNVSASEAVRAQHSQDEGPDLGLLPDVVAFADSTAQVAEICKACHMDGVPIVPYGTGTGLEAGISALCGGVCIDMSKMDGVLDYNPDDFDVRVRPAVTREGLNHHVKDNGLWFTVDPGAEASICGMCATGASGTNTVRYGTIKENCLNLEVVLADGRILHTGGEGKRPKKSAAGYNLTNLFIGSEGTLGVITGATVKLHPQPEAVAAAIVSFPNVESAVATVVQTMQCAVPMARMELLDEVSVKACNSYSKLELAERPTLFVEFHCSEQAMEHQISFVKDLATANGGSEFEWETKAEDRNKLWTARHKLLYATLNMRPGCRSVTTDVCVPVSRLPDLMTETREQIDEMGIQAALFGHVGDGNFHALMLFDPHDREEYDRCKMMAKKMAYRAMDAGGTCTGEHGIGTGKKKLLQRMYGGVGISTMKALKSALDPKGIMNPGKIFT